MFVAEVACRPLEKQELPWPTPLAPSPTSLAYSPHLPAAGDSRAVSRVSAEIEESETMPESSSNLVEEVSTEDEKADKGKFTTVKVDGEDKFKCDA